MTIEVSSNIYNQVEISNLITPTVSQQYSGLQEQNITIPNITTINNIIDLVNKSGAFDNNIIKI